MDHGPFLAAGIPVFTLWVDEGEYDTHHHAVSDTFDKVDPRMLALDTAVMAVAAYRLADAPERAGPPVVGRRRRPELLEEARARIASSNGLRARRPEVTKRPGPSAKIDEVKVSGR